MSKFKIITEQDLKLLNLKEEELQELDEKLFSFISSSKIKDNSPCCKNCNCEGFIQGKWPNPSTVCNNCGHDWNVHKC